MAARSQKNRREALAPPIKVEKTRAEQYADAVEGLAFYEEQLRRSLGQSKATVEDLASKLASTDPNQWDKLHHLSWSGGAFEAAGRIKALSDLLAWRERGAAWKVIRAEVLEMVLRDARSTSRSTSQTSNLCEDAHRQACAELYERDLAYLERCEAKIAGLAFELEAAQAQHLIDGLSSISVPL